MFHGIILTYLLCGLGLSAVVVFAEIRLSLFEVHYEGCALLICYLRSAESPSFEIERTAKLSRLVCDPLKSKL